jgi:hypothetical protein
MQPDRQRVGALLEELAFDEEAVRARLTDMHALCSLNEQLGFGLSLEQAEALYKKCALIYMPYAPYMPRAAYTCACACVCGVCGVCVCVCVCVHQAVCVCTYCMPLSPPSPAAAARADPAHLHCCVVVLCCIVVLCCSSRRHETSLEKASKYVSGMHALKAKAFELGCPTSREMEKVFALHQLDEPRASRHLYSVHALGTDREFLAEAGQPNGADILRSLTSTDYEYESSKVRHAIHHAA